MKIEELEIKKDGAMYYAVLSNLTYGVENNYEITFKYRGYNGVWQSFTKTLTFTLYENKITGGEFK